MLANLEKVIYVVILLLTFLVLGSVSTMIGTMILHSVFPVVPSLGIWDAFLVNVGLWFILAPHSLMFK